MSDQELFAEMVGTSHSLQFALTEAKRVAPTDRSILLLGEPGTGKTLLAQTIHNASKRRQGPFVTLHGNLSGNALAGILFDLQQGKLAVTDTGGALKPNNKGTLFFDDLQYLSTDDQIVLLQLLHNRTFTPPGGKDQIPLDFRLIAASCADIETIVAHGTLRADLISRFDNVIRLPALRERVSDIPTLVSHFIRAASRRYAGLRSDTSVTLEQVEPLLRRSWPGNIRELREVVELCVAISEGARIDFTAALARLQQIKESAIAPTGPPSVFVAWDPQLLNSDDYARLVCALGDLSRAVGGVGISRLKSLDYGIPIEAGVVS